MKVEEIRLINLQQLIKELGTTAAVAKAADTSPSYLSQIITRVPSRTGKPRDIGHDLARKLENGCGKPVGWMDALHDDDPLSLLMADLSPEAGELIKEISAADHDGKLPAATLNAVRELLKLSRGQ